MHSLLRLNGIWNRYDLWINNDARHGGRVSGAAGRGRTDTSVRTRDFESRMSANFITAAAGLSKEERQKDVVA